MSEPTTDAAGEEASPTPDVGTDAVSPTPEVGTGAVSAAPDTDAEPGVEPDFPRASPG